MTRVPYYRRAGVLALALGLLMVPLALNTASATHRVPDQAQSVGASLVPNFRQTISASQCTARAGTPGIHQSPIAFNSCSPPAFIAGTAAALGPASTSSVSLTATGSDYGISAVINDVHVCNGPTTGCEGPGIDYDPIATGNEVTVVTKLRVSDHSNNTGRATVVDFDFPVGFACAPTAPSTSPPGSSCGGTTSFNAIVAGFAFPGQSQVMQTFRTRLKDSGLNGVAGDSDDRDFAMEGLSNK